MAGTIMESISRQELGQLLNLEIDLVAEGRQNRPGNKIAPKYITIHNTSNTSKGADARAHANMVKNVGFYWIVDKKTGDKKKNWVSWHYTCDDLRAIKHLPINERGLHAGSEANMSSIGIEICMNKGIDQAAANLRAARLSACLLHDLKLPVANLRMHKHWTGKACPTLLLDTFEDFRATVQQLLDALAAPPPRDGVVTGEESASIAAGDGLAPESGMLDSHTEEDHDGIARMVNKTSRKGFLGLFGG
jgi:hypothetical protein